MLEHSNLVKSIGRFDTRNLNESFRRPKAAADLNQNQKININDFRSARCEKCRVTIEIESKRLREQTIMIRKQNDLELALAKYEERFKAAQQETEKLKSVLNDFRLIGLAFNPVAGATGNDSKDVIPDFTGTEIYVATHEISVDKWTLENRIRFVNLLQKISEKTIIAIRKEQNKVTIKQDILEARRDEVQKSQTKINEEDREKRRQTIYKEFHKMMTSNMKSAQCKAIAKSQNISLEDAAKQMCKAFGILIPADY